MTLKGSDELTLSTLLEKLDTALISNNKNILTDIPTLITLALTSIAMYAEALVKGILNKESKKLTHWFKHILIDEEDKTTFANYLKNPQNPEVKGELRGALKRVLKGNDTAIVELQAIIKAIEAQQS
jgi:hypothetical protein